MAEIVYMPLAEVLALKPYPTADIFPMLVDSADPPAGYEGMTMPQFAGLILKEGVREPLVIWNGVLLDGRNRREAAKQAAAVKPEVLAGLEFEPADLSSIPVRHADFKDEEEADSWVLSLNVSRRTLTKDQLACIAVRFWEIESERSNQRKEASQFGSGAANFSGTGERGDTREILSRRFNVSKDYIQKARSLFLNDKPKFEKAASGKEKVIGKLVSPGQKIKPDTNPYELALQQFNDAFNKMKAAMIELAKSSGETRIAARTNTKTKIDLMPNIHSEVFDGTEDDDLHERIWKDVV